MAGLLTLLSFDAFPLEPTVAVFTNDPETNRYSGSFYSYGDSSGLSPDSLLDAFFMK